LERLGIKDRITERLDPTVFIPAPGQGILAVEIKKERTELLDMLDAIVHAPTSRAAEIERAFSNAIGGGCKLPVGCYAEIATSDVGGATAVAAQTVTVYAAVGNEEGSGNGNGLVRRSASGLLADGEKIAQALAKEF
jgi:hydroxymethylbilane synthase